MNSPQNEPRRLLTAKEACRYLSISDRTLWSMVDSGRLKCVRFGLRNIRYDIADLDAFIQRCKNGGVQ